MTAALICTGPTAVKFPGGYQLTIGVKRAATGFLCDWVAIIDSPALTEICPRLLGSPKLLTRRDYRPKYSAIPGMDVESLSGPLGFAQWTSVASLSLAAFLGATTIDVYGADWTSEPDYDGYVPTEMNRSVERWEREIATWNAAVAMLRGKGVKVNRYGHPR